MSVLEAMSLQNEVDLESDPSALYPKAAVAVQQNVRPESVVFQSKEEDRDGEKVCSLYPGPGTSDDQKSPLEELCYCADFVAVGRHVCVDLLLLLRPFPDICR